MNRSLTLVTFAVATSFPMACATSVPLPNPRGTETSPGIYAFTGDTEHPVQAPARDTTWDATAFNPGLETGVVASREAELMTSVGPAAAAGWLFYRAYKATFSRADGTTCRFAPSCSEFGLEASRRHGLRGVAMTFGRLQRNHSDEKRYPMVSPPFLSDPVNNYDFWFKSPKLDDFASYRDQGHAWVQHLRAVKKLEY